MHRSRCGRRKCLLDHGPEQREAAVSQLGCGKISGHEGPDRDQGQRFGWMGPHQRGPDRVSRPAEADHYRKLRGTDGLWNHGPLPSRRRGGFLRRGRAPVRAGIGGDFSERSPFAGRCGRGSLSRQAMRRDWARDCPRPGRVDDDHFHRFMAHAQPPAGGPGRGQPLCEAFL